MNLSTKVFFAVLITMLGCSRPQRSASDGSSEGTQLLRLQEIRPYLTHDLTMEDAERRFGSAGGLWVSGSFYAHWLLDDSNFLFAAFSLDTERLQQALVANPKGKVVERVLDIPKSK